MSRISYVDSYRPGVATLLDIERANDICREYGAQGFDLTLRQLYYQFVARGYIPNTLQSYKRLGNIVNDARMAGLLDWSYIVDRTRNLAGNSHWDDPESIIQSAASSFRIDKWADQPYRVEVWVEKEALAGIVGRVATQHDVDYFSCRGYVSQSEMFSAGQRLSGYLYGGQDVVVLHLGDHDPSGIDMTRDIRDRLELFIGHNAHRLEVRRIALNMDQIEQYGPPPNPAKLTDSRASNRAGTGYVDVYGDESWELDALEPTVLADLITEHIDGIRDDVLYQAQLASEREQRTYLTATSNRWDEVVSYLRDTEL